MAYGDARRATGRDESFCLDVVQDAMIRVIRSMRTMETRDQLRNWLRIVVQTCAYDRLRKEARRRRREEALGTERRPAEHRAAEEQIEWLRSELTKLDAQDAGFLMMRYRFGWTLERIGRMTGLRPGAVDRRVRRAAAELREKAEETLGE